jgi:hypothetical protein
MQRAVFLDITPYSLVKDDQCSRRTYCIHFRVSQARNQHEADGKQIQKKGAMCSLKHWLTFTGLHSIISQEIYLCIPTTVRTWNPTGGSQVFNTTPWRWIRCTGTAPHIFNLGIRWSNNNTKHIYFNIGLCIKVQ